MKSLFFVIVVFISVIGYGQNITPEQLLGKSIKYHDPNGNWQIFEDTFTVVMTTPNSPKRTSIITIDLPAEYFSVKATKDTVTTTYTLNKGKCEMAYNGQVLDSVEAKEKR